MARKKYMQILKRENNRRKWAPEEREQMSDKLTEKERKKESFDSDWSEGVGVDSSAAPSHSFILVHSV